MTTPGTSELPSFAPAARNGRRKGLLPLALTATLVVAPVSSRAVAAAEGSRGSTPAIRFLEERVKMDPLDFVAMNRLAGAYLARLRETADLHFLDLAEEEARASLAAVPAAQNTGGLSILAVVEFESHHFVEALKLAQQAYTIDPRRVDAIATAGDAALELGRYAQAESRYRELVAIAPTPPVLARWARIEELKGNTAEAMAVLRHDSAAMLREGVSSRDVSWYQVRRGELYFRTGDFANADVEYRAALDLCPTCVAAQEHLAELRGAQGRYYEAVALYLALIDRVPRAEFFQSLGDLYVFMGRPKEATFWHERALAAYRKSIRQGHLYYVHHLAGYFSDSEEDPAEALVWARRDLELRQSIYAYDALAWALYKNGALDDARAAMTKARALGTNDAHLLYHAGLIESAAGDLEQGRDLLRQALAANPRYNAFHVHR